MKELTTEMFTFTEIGGVGEMIYKAVRFPAYYSEYDKSRDDDIIYPAFTYQVRPSTGADYSITGQELLADLCNLYKKINVPNNVENITELVLNWCQKNIYPYHIDDLCEFIEDGDFDDPYFHVNLQKDPAFGVKRFVDDLCELGSAYEFYDVLRKIHYDHNASAGRNFYYVGRFCESNPLLEKYQQYADETEYLNRIDDNYDNLICSLIELFPYVKMRLKQNKKHAKLKWALR